MRGKTDRPRWRLRRIARDDGTNWVMAACTLAMLTGPAGLGAQPLKKPPYWASIEKNAAVMRVGPAKRFPANWVYLRRDLPVRVIETYPDWRKVQDPDGTTGWFHHVRLLKDEPDGHREGRHGRSSCGQAYPHPRACSIGSRPAWSASFRDVRADGAPSMPVARPAMCSPAACGARPSRAEVVVEFLLSVE